MNLYQRLFGVRDGVELFTGRDVAIMLGILAAIAFGPLFLMIIF